MKSSFMCFTLCAILLSACRTENKKSDLQKDKPLQKVTTINGYPKDFVGCGCALSKTEEEFAAKEFVYLEKYGLTDESKNFKMISLNGKEIRWNKAHLPKEFTIQVNYDKIEREEPERIKKIGKMTINFQDGTVIKTSLVGVCGC